ncbi:MAG: pyruvate kinase [Planctomycetota bacterium]|jgi:pyruvate kinase
MDKRTKIVATVGPACSSVEKLRALIDAGVDIFRINFSHGDETQRGQFLKDIRAAEQEVGRPVAICGDLCGPKIRVGMIRDGEVDLKADAQIVIQREPVEGTSERISTTLPELVDVVGVRETILLADGRLRFEVVSASPPEAFTCRVLVGGVLSSGKGVNLPQTELPVSALTEKDRQDVAWIAERDFDYVALSFVQRPENVDELRSLLKDRGSDAHIITKIEKPQALDQIDAIIDRADAVMIARGDLGVEMDFPAVPIAQKAIAQKCQVAGKPCIVATEMMESMITSVQPTRAEVSDVANAVFDKADAVMLSAESSIGKHPIEAVTAMGRIIIASEGYVDQYGAAEAPTVDKFTRTAALAASARRTMELMDIKAIATFTATGTTARVMAKNRPRCPILALSADPSVVRRACLYYGVVPHLVDLPSDVQGLLAAIQDAVKGLRLAATGDRIIVLTGHPVGTAGGTRALIVEEIV